MPTPRIRLGQLLVDAKLLSSADLDEALVIQRADGRRLGTLLVERGLINETQLTQVLSHQLSVPWVSLVHIEFSRQLLNLVPHHIAERFCLVPIYVRHVRGQGQTVYVAMDDPSNDDGLRECETHAGLPVKAMIAPPSDIRNAIRVYYGTKTTPSILPEARASRMPASSMPSTDVASMDRFASMPVASIGVQSSDLPALSEPSPSLSNLDLEIVTPNGLEMSVTPTAPLTHNYDVSPETLPDAGASRRFAGTHLTTTRVPIVSASDLASRAERLRQLDLVEDLPGSTPENPTKSLPVSAIPQPKGRAPRMIALTLLDGTTISLPAPRKTKSAPETVAAALTQPQDDEPIPPTLNEESRSGLTARDLVAALRAVCQGANASEILGPNERMEAIVAALLSVLLRKGVVADWEFVDELRKM